MNNMKPRSTKECNQMNIVYRILRRLKPSADQIRKLSQEAELKATVAEDEKDRAELAMFIYQLREYTRRMNMEIWT